MWNAVLVDIGHDVFEAIKLFDVPEISSRLISSIERTLFVMMMLFVCGGQSTHGLKCGFRIQGGGRFCIPPLVQIQLYPYKIHPVKHSRNRISVRARHVNKQRRHGQCLLHYLACLFKFRSRPHPSGYAFHSLSSFLFWVNDEIHVLSGYLAQIHVLNRN